jgi:hypothetical protein
MLFHSFTRLPGSTVLGHTSATRTSSNTSSLFLFLRTCPAVHRRLTLLRPCSVCRWSPPDSSFPFTVPPFHRPDDVTRFLGNICRQFAPLSTRVAIALVPLSINCERRFRSSSWVTHSFAHLHNRTIHRNLLARIFVIPASLFTPSLPHSFDTPHSKGIVDCSSTRTNQFAIRTDSSYLSIALITLCVGSLFVSFLFCHFRLIVALLPFSFIFDLPLQTQNLHFPLSLSLSFSHFSGPSSVQFQQADH